MSAALLGAWLAATSEPSPGPTPGLRDDLDPTMVSPGVLGFLVLFGLALVSVLLFVSMTGKVRRVKVRGDVLAEAEAALEEDGDADDDGGRGPGGDGSAGREGDGGGEPPLGPVSP